MYLTCIKILVAVHSQLDRWADCLTVSEPQADPFPGLGANSPLLKFWGVEINVCPDLQVAEFRMTSRPRKSGADWRPLAESADGFMSLICAKHGKNCEPSRSHSGSRIISRDSFPIGEPRRHITGPSDHLIHIKYMASRRPPVFNVKNTV